MPRAPYAAAAPLPAVWAEPVPGYWRGQMVNLRVARGALAEFGVARPGHAPGVDLLLRIDPACGELHEGQQHRFSTRSGNDGK